MQKGVRKESIVTNFAMIQAIKDAPKPSYSIGTGMKELDESIGGGVRPGELYVITGFTKNGKTLFSKSLTAHFCSIGEFPLWFSYEEAPEQFLSCFPNMSESLVFYMPDSLKYNDINWLLGMVDEARERYDIHCVFIDHLHFLFDMTALRNPSLAIGNYVRILKRYAIEKSITIFLICHTTKAKVESPDDISYTAIRDSSFIAQESDCVMVVHRNKSDGVVMNYQSIVKVEFHRRTGVWNKVIDLVKDGNYLRELQT